MRFAPIVRRAGSMIGGGLLVGAALFPWTVGPGSSLPGYRLANLAADIGALPLAVRVAAVIWYVVPLSGLAAILATAAHGRTARLLGATPAVIIGGLVALGAATTAALRAPGVALALVGAACVGGAAALPRRLESGAIR